MAEHYIHNGEKEKTIAALKRAASKASGKARRVIQGLAKALNPNSAARGRKAKGAASMAKKRTKKATARRRAKHNPTARRGGFKRSWRRRRANPSRGLASKVRGMDLTGIAMEGAGVAAGSLALSFVDRQVEKFLPNVNPLIRTGISTALVAGGAAYFSGGKGFLRSMAIGAVAGGVTQIASEFMPGLFGSVDYYYDMGGWNPDGTWNEELGDAEYDEMGGVLYDRTAAAPSGRSF